MGRHILTIDWRTENKIWLTVAWALFLLILTPLPAWGDSFTWSGGTGDWTVSSNWLPVGVPGAGDTATITSGSVTINNGEDIVVDGVALSGGTLSISGTLSIEDSMQWTGGMVNGSGELGIANDATLALASGFTKTLSGSVTLDNAGTLLWSDGLFSVQQTARIDNFGLFDITHAGDRILGHFTSPTATLFNDSTGIIRKREGIGTTTLDTVFDFDNQGLVDVQSGTLQVRTQTVNAGEMTVASGTMLNFTSSFGVSHNHTASSTLSGNGEIRFSAGSTTISGNYTFTGLTRINNGTATFNLANVDFPDLRLESGTLQGTADITLSGDAVWQGGTLTGSGQVLILGGITLALNTGFTKILSDSRELLNQGTVLWSDGTFRVEGATRIDNFNLFDITHAGDRTLGHFTNPTATLFNDATGTIRKRTGTGTTIFDAVFDFDNQGLVDVHSGTLRVRSDTTHSGVLLVRADALVEFTSSFGTTHTLTSSGRIGGTGEVRLTSGVVVMESLIAPGLPGASDGDLGTLTIAPGLALSSANVIEIRVGDTAHDRVVTPGSAQLDGELEVILISNNGPGGSLFEIVSADQGVTGTFALLSADNSALPASREWEVLYEPNRALLLVGPDALFSDRFQP